MLTIIDDLFPASGTFSYFLLRGALTFLIAAITARFLSWSIWRIVLSQAVITHHKLSERRQTTLRSLLCSLMDGLAVIITIVLVLGMFVQPAVLITGLGLFSAGLGFGARPYVSDFLGGVVLLFEDQFVIGDKVEMGDRNVIGTVEQVSLRTTRIRGDMGELWIVPNGDVRTIRNFTRGSFSSANIRLTVPTAKLSETLIILLDLITEPGEDVLERPEIISEEGEIGATTTLLLRVKARHGTAPKVRRQLLARIQAELSEHCVLDEAFYTTKQD
jgi:small conductance mechanosensitive channel